MSAVMAANAAEGRLCGPGHQADPTAFMQCLAEAICGIRW
jgi:hypothetical protein